MVVNFSSMLPSFSHGLLSNIGLLLGSRFACFLPIFFSSSHSPCLRVNNIYQLHYLSPSIYLFKSMFFQRKCFGNEASQQERPALHFGLELFWVEFACSLDRLTLPMSAYVRTGHSCKGVPFLRLLILTLLFQFLLMEILLISSFRSAYFSLRISLLSPWSTSRSTDHSATSRQPQITREQWVFPNSLAGASWPCLGGDCCGHMLFVLNCVTGAWVAASQLLPATCNNRSSTFVPGEHSLMGVANRSLAM